MTALAAISRGFFSTWTLQVICCAASSAYLGSVKKCESALVIKRTPLEPVYPVRYRTLAGEETSRASIFNSVNRADRVRRR